jgi:hypothetical protein
MSHQASLQTLRQALDDLRHRRLGIPAFCAAYRAEGALLAALPPRYAQVLEDLLGRLEAGSLFTEESCSFSQKDLQDNLAAWLDKAAHTLGAQA